MDRVMVRLDLVLDNEGSHQSCDQRCRNKALMEDLRQLGGAWLPPACSGRPLAALCRGPAARDHALARCDTSSRDQPSRMLVHGSDAGDTDAGVTSIRGLSPSIPHALSKSEPQVLLSVTVSPDDTGPLNRERHLVTFCHLVTKRCW